MNDSKHINPRFLGKLTEKLFSDAEEKERFIAALSSGTCGKEAEIAFENGEKYQLDNSSVFAASVLKAISHKIENILDVCAAPGGKSAYASRELKSDFILANESVNKRIPMLISNLKRCGISPAAVSTLDSKLLALKYENAFDVVLVDAPCSGQSLIAKGEKAPGALNPATVNLNSNRQKRILANSAVCVAAEGYLAYMTCTFSIEENEKVAAWFLKKFPEFEPIKVRELEDFRSKFSETPAYRLYPHQNLGAGAFTVLFQNTKQSVRNSIDFGAEKFVWKSF
jgi:16S rRNA C967 or C1407 C5-methylase (RsmB/RsmF family)